ncbi:MAG: Holliday junction resolvase RuvX [Desulfomonilaceae bacterium]|nr:Holliday junction resolvase RuvX [Desulfomonilaceae bacterium]
MALDIGSKRIGIAMSDELGFTAQGLESMQCAGLEADLEHIIGLVERYSVDEIVVGMPYNMNGSEGPQASKVRAFMEMLGGRIDIPLTEWDERLSTAAAERTLLEADMSRSKRRKVIDKLAAVIILQGYLDRKRFEDWSDS